MFSFLRSVFRAAVLFEAGAALLFFGVLIHDPQIERSGVEALEELRVLGYDVPTSSDPVRVYPAERMKPLEAGGWRPGVILLRPNPLGSTEPKTYLRHELMHEASFRTCGGKLPLWAEEAAAVNFSGELAGGGTPVPQPEEIPSRELEHLREKIRIGAPFDSKAWLTLKRLVATRGWPREPCAVSKEIQKLVSPPPVPSEAVFSAVLISVASGQILESSGDLRSRFPPGSLLKIPYAASLRGEQGEALGAELAKSNTAKLLERKSHVDQAALSLLLSAAGDSALVRRLQALPGTGGTQDAMFVRTCLGDRDEEGGFPFQASLHDLALVMRASLLYRPDAFPGLSRNGFAEGTTLYKEPPAARRILQKLHAISKTGTVSDERGKPVVGHLMTAWPAESPVFLAVFRTIGGSGASNLRRASHLLEKWSAAHPVGAANARVSLMTLTPPGSWEVFSDCPEFGRTGPDGWKEEVSTSGRFRILSSARGSRTERFVSGILKIPPDRSKLVLETDIESYIDAVVSTEAQDLRGEAAEAFRAVVAWNAIHGRLRHPETRSVCDSTHCMVFMGAGAEPLRRSGKTRKELIRLLDEIAAVKGLDWLPFSKGGSEAWETRIPSQEAARLTGETVLLDIRRERARNGAVSIHLYYDSGEEKVPCDLFRLRMKLRSCPEEITHEAGKNEWIFRGIGEGHGLGLSVERAGELAKSGLSAAGILKDMVDAGAH
ncbi:MAG: hypothetical protein AB9866_30805 [Syntrophobacteraceae bacterium]